MTPDLDRRAKPESAIAPEEVRAALDKATASEAFAKAGRPARFLRHLVETALAGEHHLLKESVLGTDVFERPASWDPRLDPIVRQEAARLRKRLAKYYSGEGIANKIRIELPVGGYIPSFRREAAEIEAPQAVDRAPARMFRTFLAVAVLIVAAAILWRVLPRRETAVSIAVLPFANLTGDPNSQYFSDGLTDEITDSLARLKNVRVIARSSAFQFKGKAVDIHEVGRRLNVTHILEGSVERSADRVKIIAHLERVSDGSLLWSNTYERNAADLYAIQSELAAGIAGGLKVAAGAPAATHIPNSEAHDFAMKGRYDLQQLTRESVGEAESDFRRAIEIDPNYAAAYFGLGMSIYDRYAARGSTYQTQEERQSAEQFVRKSLELDPDLSSAHAAMALMAMQYDWDWGRAERELTLAGPSNALAEDYYGLLLIYRGRFAEADRHLRRMLDLDPFSNVTMNNLAIARNLEGRFAETRELAQKVLAEYPRILWPRQTIGATYVEEGRPDLALPIFRDLKQRFPPAQMFEAMAEAKAGHRDEALRLIRPFEEKYPNAGVPMQWFAMFHALLGDQTETVKWLERSADAHEFQVLNLAVHPLYVGMRNSAGFQALERRMGLGR